MRTLVADNHGILAAVPGDFLLALFSTPSDAMKTAVAFLKSTEQFSNVPLKFRVGLNVGDVYEQEGDYLGMAINIAARLQEVAATGNLVMSRTFRDSLAGLLEYPIMKIGDLSLKNIAEPVEAYELRFDNTEAGVSAFLRDTGNKTARSVEIPEIGELDRPAIIVRPFNVAGDVERAAIFADGLFEELVTSLGVFSEAFRSVSNPSQSARNADYEISGQVRNGDRFRITSHLVDLRSGDTIWSDRFDFAPDATYDAQERITIAVITALQLNLTEGESAQIWSRRNTSLIAWEKFHLGRIHESKYTREANQEARKFYREALEIDPEYYPAMTALGFSYIDSIRLGWSGNNEESLKKAVKYAKIASKLSSNDPYTLALLAYIERAEKKFDLSLKTMRRAVKAAPRNGELIAYYANMLWMHGENERAINQYKRSLTLIPHPPSWIFTNLGLALISTGDIHGALQIFQSVVKNDPDYVRARAGLVVALVRMGQLDAAKESYRMIDLIAPEFDPQDWLDLDQFKDVDQISRFVTDLKCAL